MANNNSEITEENIVRDTEKKEVIDTNRTELTTDTSDVPQPFPAPLALQDTPDVPDTPAADSEEEPSKSPSPGQIAAVPSQPIYVGKTAIAPQITTATQAATPAQTSTAATQSSILVSDSQYLLSGKFNQCIANNKKYANRKTGFKNWDSIRSFEPGIYLIMGETSAGKTTFVLQWCSQIAINGEHVLFLGMEQSREFLTSKNLSRDFFETYLEDAKRNNGQSSLPVYTSTEIRNGCVDNAVLNKQELSYAQKIKDKIYTVSTNFSGTVEDIFRYVDAFIKQTGEIPVVAIDYIQLLCALTTPNGYMLDAKTSMDLGIRMLKQYQVSRGLTLLVISSLSRQGYAEAIALHHAKESGSLEYTCDFAVGLQLREIHNNLDASGKKLSDAQKKANLAKAKSESPRKVEAVFLKDRAGVQNSTVYFDYYSAYETFVATDLNGNPMV